VLTVQGRDRAVVLTPEQYEELVWRRRALEEILATAATTMGGREAAERWLGKAALALHKRRPLDLLSTPAGVELVKRVLGRMEYGVYT
jgi:putative toxin-antitoxin system antitoxin component (TIGR02293 family)